MATVIEILKASKEIEEVYTLNQFVKVLAGHRELNRKPQDLEGFLETTLVCTSRDYKFPEIRSCEVKHSLIATVDSIIYSLLGKKPSGSGLRLEEPTQTLGYSIYTKTGALRKNPTLSLTLKSVEWEAFHKHVGTEILTHLVNGINLYVFQKIQESYVQVIGTNIANYMKTGEPINVVKKEPIRSFKDFKAFHKTYKGYLKDLQMKKPDILLKLPLINRTRMLYSPIIRKEKWFPARHPLNQEDAASQIAMKILGPNSSNKYYSKLTELFGKFVNKFKKTKLGAHLNHHCPLPSAFKKRYIDNINEGLTFEWLFNQHCSWQQVCNYVLILLKDLIPKELLGFPANKRAFLKSVIMFLKLGLYEKISCSALVSKLKFSKVQWIKEQSDNPRRLLIGKIVHWIFNDFVVPLLQTSFYITEKQNDNKTLFYYRKPVWAIAQQKGKEKLEEGGFFKKINPIEAMNAQAFSQFPPAKLRIQPKPNDFRPIMHFKSKIKVSANMALSGNNLLAGVPQLLKNSIDSQDKVLAIDYPAIIQKLVQLNTEWEARGRPKLYFLSMDIAKAFDSVKLEHLRGILDKLKLPHVSSFYKYVQLAPRISRPKNSFLAKQMMMKFKKLSVNDGQFPVFQDLPFLDNTINVPTSKTMIYTMEKLDMISKILIVNVIKYNRQWYRGMRGIPQGLACSPLLSNIYFSEFEEIALSRTKEKFKDNLLCVIRLHDDYLVLSESQEVIEHFLKEIQVIAEQFSFSFSDKKIVSNIQAPWVPNFQENIEGWVGLDITEDLQITPHIAKNSPQVSFHYTLGKCTSAEIKNKLVKLMNITINLLRSRSRARPDVAERALEQMVDVQAARFVLFLKAVTKFYRERHSSRQISRTIVSVCRISSLSLDICPNFFTIAVSRFAKKFKSSSLHKVSTRLTNYLKKLT